MKSLAVTLSDAWVRLTIRLGWHTARIKPSYVFRDDGELAEQAERRRTLDRVLQASEKPYTAMSARRQNVRAAGLDRDRRQVSK